jgi:HlyD family type I secretion membrane fusion protein
MSQLDNPNDVDLQLTVVPDHPPLRKLLVAAMILIVIFFGGLGSWAALALLDSAAVASAHVTVAGNKKTVQHLEGGIVRELLVKEGDQVAPGQPLIRLDDTQTRAMLAQLRSRYDNLLAREARLLAERDRELDQILFPVALTSRSDDDNVYTAISGEKAIYQARKEYMIGRERILKQRVLQLKKEIQGLQAQLMAEWTQLKLVRDEKDSIKSLFDKGMVDKPRLLAAKRAEAGLQGSRGEHQALVAQAEQRIGETELEIIDLNNRFLSEVVSDLKETQEELTDLTQQLKAAEDVLARTEVQAPVGGTVVGLEVHTVGGVVSPGQKILDIVPREDVLELEAQIDPNDIDVVHAGLEAQVVLTAYKQRTTPTLQGRVIRVSADSFSDPRTGRTYFLARISVEQAELERMDDVDLYPGMPAEVMIQTGQQTALDYLLSPITQSMRRAFRES